MPATLAPHDPQPCLRPVQVADRPAMRRFVQDLSAASRRLRFHGGVKPDSDRLLTHLTTADGWRHIAFVAVLRCDDGDLIVGEARCVRDDAGEAEFAIAVADAWQGRGLAQRLLRALLAAAAEAGVQRVAGDVLAGNARMAAFMARAGFSPADEGGEPDVQRWERTLAAAAHTRAAAAPGWMARLGAAARHALRRA